MDLVICVCLVLLWKDVHGCHENGLGLDDLCNLESLHACMQPAGMKLTCGPGWARLAGVTPQCAPVTTTWNQRLMTAVQQPGCMTLLLCSHCPLAQGAPPWPVQAAVGPGQSSPA